VSFHDQRNACSRAQPHSSQVAQHEQANQTTKQYTRRNT
jgi:hypothetical protein